MSINAFYGLDSYFFVWYQLTCILKFMRRVHCYIRTVNIIFFFDFSSLFFMKPKIVPAHASSIFSVTSVLFYHLNDIKTHLTETPIRNQRKFLFLSDFVQCESKSEKYVFLNRFTTTVTQYCLICFSSISKISLGIPKYLNLRIETLWQFGRKLSFHVELL